MIGAKFLDRNGHGAFLQARGDLTEHQLLYFYPYGPSGTTRPQNVNFVQLLKP